jgi:hypothetical protein
VRVPGNGTGFGAGDVNSDAAGSCTRTAIGRERKSRHGLKGLASLRAGRLP